MITYRSGGGSPRDISSLGALDGGDRPRRRGVCLSSVVCRLSPRCDPPATHPRPTRDPPATHLRFPVANARYSK